MLHPLVPPHPVCPQAVFEVDQEKGLILTELYEGVSVEDVRAATGCSFEV